jgi:phosphoribosylglycinamide formyltransferase-1
MALRIAVLISGTGSNLSAILEAIDRKQCAAEVCAVLSDKRSAAGLQLARARVIPSSVVALQAYPDRAAWDRALADAMAAANAELIVLAGFMKIVGPAIIERFAGRIVNVHPSLLPLFPGIDGPAQAVAAGVRVSGCTVHLVDRGVDTGRILAQAAVPVLPGDDAAVLHRRIQAAEHRLLPAVINAIATGRMHDGALSATAPDALGDQVLFSPASLIGPSH